MSSHLFHQAFIFIAAIAPFDYTNSEPNAQEKVTSISLLDLKTQENTPFLNQACYCNSLYSSASN